MMIKFLITIITINSVSIFVQCGPPDSAKQIKTLVEESGYEFSEHFVKTEDGYILAIHRINSLNSINSDTESSQKVVLCAHGIMGSSVDWVVSGQNVSLAFLLADEGYDVWLFNARGVTNSKKHETLLETSYKYWDFSGHEIGYYDLPATIDYILDITQKKQLDYVGFSQGGGILFIMTSMRPEYNQKVRVAALLAPAVYLGGLSGVIKFLFQFTYPLSGLLEKVGHFEIFSYAPLWRVVSNLLCSEGSPLQFLCFGALFSLSGDGSEEKDPSKLAEYLTYFPAGISTKQFFYYGFMNLNPGHFRQYDYGSEINMEKYNSTEPPEYQVNKTNIPIAIFQGLNDIIITTEDINILTKQLPNVFYRKIIKEKKLNHLDFIYGRDIRQLVYLKIVDLFKKEQFYSRRRGASKRRIHKQLLDGPSLIF